MISLIERIGSYVGRSILFVMGWECPTPKVYAKGFREKKLVIAFSHTSMWDFVMMIIMMLAVPEMRPGLYTVIMPKYHQILGPKLSKWLDWLNLIPSTRAEDSGEGFVDKISRILPPQFHLLIAPKGKRIKSGWRSGYYHIVQKTQASVCAAGIDYERKCLFVGEIHEYSPEAELDEMNEFLLDELKEVVPLNLDWSEHEIRTHNPVNVGVVDPIVMSTVLFPLYPLWLMVQIDLLTAVVGLGTITFSSLYHQTRETNDTYLKWDKIMVGVGLSFSLWTFVRYGMWTWNPVWIASWFFAGLSYHLGSGREQTPQRTYQYLIFHTLFHIFMSYVISIPLILYCART